MTILEIIECETGKKVTESTSLDSLGLDSLEFLNLLSALSEATGKDVADEKVAGLDTVGDLLREFA